jgi:hypothetical protein
MAYDGEIQTYENPEFHTTQPGNIALLIDHLKGLKPGEYEWLSTSNCVIGHVRKLRGADWGARDDYSHYRSPSSQPASATWMGVSTKAYQSIYTGFTGAERCRTRKDAISFLSHLGGMPKPPSFFARVRALFA